MGAGPDQRPAPSTEAVYRDRPLRLFALDHPIAGPGLEASVTFVLGTTLNSRDALLRHLWAVGFGQQLALIVTAGLFMILGLRMGLAPLLRLRDAVMARPGSSLETLEAGAVQAELQPLVVALNQQIDRVQKQLAAQHRFVNVQATDARRHLGIAEQDAALAAIQSGTQQLSRLSGQLLTLARAEPGSRRPRADRVDLGALARRVLDDFAEPALAKGIDLGLALNAIGERPVQIEGYGPERCIRVTTINTSVEHKTAVTGFLKQRKQSCGVGRQYTGSAGKITNCQIGVFASYISRHGHAFIDRALYLPKAWADDEDRRRKAHVSAETAFATKPQLAATMIERAIASGVPFKWLAADSVYGVGALETVLRRAGKGYVLGVASTHLFTSWGQERAVAGTAEGIAKGLDASAWQRLSAGEGTKGPRLYDWAYCPLADLDAAEYEGNATGSWTRGVLIRTTIVDGDMAYTNLR